MKYAKYDQKTIFLVSKSRNPNLFPELKIPRSTANYWIRTKQHLKLKIETSDDRVHCNVLKNEIRNLKHEKRKLRNELQAIKAYIYILNKNNLIKSPSNSYTRFQIIQAIRNNRGRNSIRNVLLSLQISFSTYKRWAKVDPPTLDQNKYFQKKCRSLTASEVLILKSLYMNKSFFFFPLHALSTKAKKEQLLYVSPRTWGKYIKILKLKRPVYLEKRKKVYQIGIRTSIPHEIWHIDVTEFRIKKEKIYMQAIVDNYSRSVLSSHVSNTISGFNTVNLINEAITQFGPPKQIMSDAGKENLNHEVRMYLSTFEVKQIIAKVNTKFSNSISEVFFRTLKWNYLNHLNIKDKTELVRKINFYITNYNSEIPHSALNFRTPEEVLNEVSRDYYPDLFKQYQKLALEQRMKEFKD